MSSFLWIEHIKSWGWRKLIVESIEKIILSYSRLLGDAYLPDHTRTLLQNCSISHTSTLRLTGQPNDKVRYSYGLLFNPLEWIASNFSLQYQPIIKH